MEKNSTDSLLRKRKSLKKWSLPASLWKELCLNVVSQEGRKEGKNKLEKRILIHLYLKQDFISHRVGVLF